MPNTDPYALCPCGSGKKMKWCCLAAEPFVEKAARLMESNQVGGAIRTLEEGIKKHPKLPWLWIEKGGALAQNNQVESAIEALQEAIRILPEAMTAQQLLVQVLIEVEGPRQAVRRAQELIQGNPTTPMNRYATIIRNLGLALAEADELALARPYLELAIAMEASDQDETDSPSPASRGLQMAVSNPSTSLWQKFPYDLEEAPEDLTEDQEEHFNLALQWADCGRWLQAAEEFATLEQTIPEALYNSGLCWLWSARIEEATSTLRRWIAQQPIDDPFAIDLEAICQQMAILEPDDLLDEVRLSWPIRNREALIQALSRHAACVDLGTRSPGTRTNSNQEEVKHRFELLDRPVPQEKLTTETSLTSLPRLLGTIEVESSSVGLILIEDAQSNSTSERFRQLVGDAIAPAHPRSAVVDQVPKFQATLEPRVWLPEEHQADPGVRRELVIRLHVQGLAQRWSETPNPAFLGRRTADQLANSDAPLDAIQLRSALFQLEVENQTFPAAQEVLANLRKRFQVPPEPRYAIDNTSVQISDVPYVRLGQVRLDPAPPEDRLIALFLQCRSVGYLWAACRVAEVLADRPDIFAEDRLEAFPVFSTLAMAAVQRFDLDTAQDWLNRGRQAVPAGRRSAQAYRWDIQELRLRAPIQPVQSWVPFLQQILESYQDVEEAGSLLTDCLLQLGLIRMIPSPDDPGRLLMDTRTLQVILSRYGSRVAATPDSVNVRAGGSAIWTPDQETPPSPGGGAIWTPGSAAPIPASSQATGQARPSASESSAEPGGRAPSKLILPG